MENVPTTVLIASTAWTNFFTALGIFAPFLWYLYPQSKLPSPDGITIMPGKAML
jgi:hypothetical protein